MAISPTLRRRRLIAELKQLREAAGLRIDTVAQRIGISASSLSRIENGVIGVKIPVLRALLAEYRVSGEDAARLEQLSREAASRGWWHLSRAVGDPVKELADFEAEARSIENFNPTVIYGPLQTREYARAVLSNLNDEAPAEDIEAAVDFRMRRQEQLAGTRLWAVIPEEVLLRPVGGRPVMAAQLNHLIEKSRQPRVTVQILPLEGGELSGLTGPFTLIRFEAPHPDVVYVEGAFWETFLELPEDVDRFQHAFDRLQAAALAPPASRDLINEVLKEMT